ncbi:hypothetical protein HXZ62_02990 [Empedobacter falsenii]|uniref:Uncharacterized protein n=1 Tax=Empedobacter falsenii TaxID=343874 RepID=A0A7H9DSQ8_9FLAO|nr:MULTISPECIES: hypothetical protein [Empedobacter]HCC94178.1 hypothetical protein [Flavobacteriaceae bacterium]MDM1061526.1 hypothetical protein [Empedobacter falsenii]MDM1549207.1 hypothetical protein [Empedobacter falsenii]MDM1551314.1 hypothetical protein [Empedobacter falsenii]QLL58248.1 hypothetical protein FH779_09195 [Empedobacter falsenii]
MEKLTINQENRIKLEEHFGELLPRLPFEMVSFYESSNSWEGQIEYNLNLKTGELTYNTIENVKHQIEISPEMMQRIESEIILMLENL